MIGGSDELEVEYFVTHEEGSSRELKARKLRGAVLNENICLLARSSAHIF